MSRIRRSLAGRHHSRLPPVECRPPGARSVELPPSTQQRLSLLLLVAVGGVNPSSASRRQPCPPRATSRAVLPTRVDKRPSPSPRSLPPHAQCRVSLPRIRGCSSSRRRGCSRLTASTLSLSLTASPSPSRFLASGASPALVAPTGDLPRSPRRQQTFPARANRLSARANRLSASRGDSPLVRTDSILLIRGSPRRSGSPVAWFSLK